MENEPSQYVEEYVHFQLVNWDSQLTLKKCFHGITTPEIFFKGNEWFKQKKGRSIVAVEFKMSYT